MSEEVDFAKIMAELISNRIDDIWDAARDTASNIANAAKARLKHTYSSYIKSLYNKHSVFKTLIYRETPHPLKEFYEPLDIENDNLHLDSPGIIALSELKRPILITGTGGCGKSTMMKAIMLDAIFCKKWIPIFIELRYLENSKTSLLDHILQNMRLNRLNLPPAFIKAALARGGYAIFLDGLDELSEKNYARISDEIQQLTQTSPDNVYLVSSRPGKDFIPWASFIELKVAPLTLKKACDLIDRLQIDKKLKRRFVKDLRSGLFEKHSTFFENPLLLCIMLLTYQDSASIPGELHNFYALAFDALYFRHDALKDGFRRPTKTGLPIDKGRTLMSAFSLVTYLKHKTVFTETEVHDFLNKAISLTGISVEPRDILSDLISAFCMLLKDGTQYIFTHRSFQEYFAALYLIQAKEEQQKKICDQFIKHAFNDQTLDLAHGMNPDLIETLVVIPFLDKVCIETKYRGTITQDVYFRFISLFFQDIGCEGSKRTDITYTFSKEGFGNYAPYTFILRRFNIRRLLRQNKENNGREIELLINHMKSLKNHKMKISDIERNQEIAKILFDCSWGYKENLQAMMKLLGEIKLRHKQQVTSFNEILKS